MFVFAAMASVSLLVKAAANLGLDHDPHAVTGQRAFAGAQHFQYSEFL